MGCKITLLALLIPLILAGCDSGDLANSTGHYEGFFVGGSVSDPVQNSVTAEVQASGQSLTVQLKTTDSTPVSFSFSVDITNESQIQFSSGNGASGYFPANLSLTKSSDGCFASSGNQLCFDGREITLLLTSGSARVSKLVLDKADPNTGTTLTQAKETPQIYTVDQLVERAKARSFTTEAEFESLIQAKLTAKTAYLNLLPHINIGSGLDLIGFATTTMLHAIGDFVPFALPSRWFQATSLADAADAEFDSYRIVQATSMNVVQGLAYSVIRDEQALITMEQNRVDITQIFDEILIREHDGSGTVQMGTSDAVKTALITLISSIESMRENITEEMRALSQAAGFINPQAVKGVVPVTIPSISGPLSGTQNGFEVAAINRSIGIVQINDLIRSTQMSKDSRYVQWLDPLGDDQGSLGFGIVSYVQIGSSMIQQLYDKKDALQAQILGLVDNAFSQSQETSDQYQLAIDGSNTAQASENRLLLDFHTGISFAMSDLVTALQSKTLSDIAQVDEQYAYLTLQAQMDFITYAGPYASLLSEKQP